MLFIFGDIFPAEAGKIKYLIPPSSPDVQDPEFLDIKVSYELQISEACLYMNSEFPAGFRKSYFSFRGYHLFPIITTFW